MSFGLTARLRPAFGIAELIASTQFWKRGQIRKFENLFAHKFENKYGNMFSHGRSGLYALFKVWGLSNAEIICPAYTCVVVQHAIVKSGNIPVFVDCEEGAFNMSLKGIEEKITAQTKCIIVTHLFGFPMNVHHINQIVKNAESRFGHKIHIIQDVAHSFGAKWEGVLVTEFGDASIFGLNVSKTISSIFGGMVTTNDEKTHQGLKDFKKNHLVKNRWKGISRFIYFLAMYIVFQPMIYALVNWLERKGYIDRFVKYFDESIIDFPADWDQLPCGLEARVGLAQLKKYDAIVNKRIQNALQWQGIEQDLEFPGKKEGASYSHCVALVDDRTEWIKLYRKKGFQLGILIEYAIPYMNAYEKYRKGEVFPIAKYYSEHCINFPVHLRTKVPDIN